jgi:hypothetical protein
MPADMGVPDGFCLRRFARVRMPSVLAFAPNGDVFVSSPGLPLPEGTGPGLGAILALPDDDRDGVADAVIPFVERVDSVWGLAFDGTSLLYALEDGVRRAPYALGDRRARAPAAAHPRVLPDPAPAAFLASVGVEGVELEVAYSIADAETSTGPLNSRAVMVAPATTKLSTPAPAPLSV